jgi:hypothetical protein
MGIGLPIALAGVDVADVSADGNARHAHEWIAISSYFSEMSAIMVNYRGVSIRGC